MTHNPTKAAMEVHTNSIRPAVIEANAAAGRTTFARKKSRLTSITGRYPTGDFPRRTRLAASPKKTGRQRNTRMKVTFAASRSRREIGRVSQYWRLPGTASSWITAAIRYQQGSIPNTPRAYIALASPGGGEKANQPNRSSTVSTTAMTGHRWRTSLRKIRSACLMARS